MCSTRTHTQRDSTKKHLSFGRFSAPGLVGQVVRMIPKGRLSDTCDGQDMPRGWDGQTRTHSGPRVAIHRPLGQGRRSARFAAQTLTGNAHLQRDGCAATRRALRSTRLVGHGGSWAASPRRDPEANVSGAARRSHARQTSEVTDTLFPNSKTCYGMLWSL